MIDISMQGVQKMTSNQINLGQPGNVKNVVLYQRRTINIHHYTSNNDQRNVQIPNVNKSFKKKSFQYTGPNFLIIFHFL